MARLAALSCIAAAACAALARGQCDCSWASKDACSNNDGSQCFCPCCSSYPASGCGGGCDCSWANANNCKNNDGSKCFCPCCKSYPGSGCGAPSPPSPPAPPAPLCCSAKGILPCRGSEPTRVTIDGYKYCCPSGATAKDPCGSGPTPPAPAPGPAPSPQGSAGTTRYWDCSGGACGGSDAIPAPNQGCSWPWGGSPQTCPHSWAPRKLAGNRYGATVYATAAASDEIYCGQGSGCTGRGGACGKCYLLSNPRSCNAEAHNVKIIVKITNQCPGSSNPVCNNQNHFDIAVPGFDYAPASVSNICDSAPRNCDPSVYGSGACATQSAATCDCSKVSSDSTLVNGCNAWKSVDWSQCQVDFAEVTCPLLSEILPANNATTVAAGR